jgi:hypothetical protein
MLEASDNNFYYKSINLYKELPNTNMSLKNNLRAIFHGIFPRKMELPKDQQELLKQLYPSIKWEQVHFYKDMPWFMLNSFAIATVLPARFSHKQLNVYLQEREKDEFYNLSTLVHEAYHILQYQELSKRHKEIEWGFCRAFMRHYIGSFFQLFFKAIFKERKSFSKASYEAYRYHPLEVEAYDQEGRFAILEGEYSSRSTLDKFVYHNPQICIKRTNYRKQKPHWLASFFALLLCILISIIRPIIELLLLISLYPIILIIGRA